MHNGVQAEYSPFLYYIRPELFKACRIVRRSWLNGNKEFPKFSLNSFFKMRLNRHILLADGHLRDGGSSKRIKTPGPGEPGVANHSLTSINCGLELGTRRISPRPSIS